MMLAVKRKLRTPQLWDRTETERFWRDKYENMNDRVIRHQLSGSDKEFQQTVAKVSYHDWNHMRRLKQLVDAGIDVPTCILEPYREYVWVRDLLNDRANKVTVAKSV